LGVIALVIASVSLAANAALIYALLRVGEFGLNAVTQARAAAAETIDDGLTFVEDLQAKGVSFSFPISHQRHADCSRQGEHSPAHHRQAHH
jgi:hypothetical protein